MSAYHCGIGADLRTDAHRIVRLRYLQSQVQDVHIVDIWSFCQQGAINYLSCETKQLGLAADGLNTLYGPGSY